LRVRALAYSLFLCGLLAYLSFRIHMAPSQVELRLERNLGEYLTVEPRVDGGEQPSLGLISARAILIPANPPLDERSILGLEDIRINDPRSARAFRRVLASESSGAAASSFSLHARKASLWLDHAVDGAPGAESHRWNFDDLLRTDALELLGARRAQVLLDRIDVRIEELRSGRPRANYTLELGDAEVRIGGTGVALDADLLEGASWSGGRIVLEWPTEGSLRIRGRIEDLDSLEPWLPLFPETHRRMLEVLQPSGAVAVDIDELALGRDRIDTFRATVRHYDTTLRLGRTGAGISRLQGEMKLTTDGLSMGKDGPRATGEVLGVPVEVAAQVTASRARIELATTRLSLELFPLEGAPPGAARRPVHALWARLGPRGFLTGTAAVGLAPGEREELEGELLIGELSLRGVPAVAGAEVSCRFQSDPSGRIGGVRGKLVADLPIEGLGRLRGEANIIQEGTQARVTLYDMRWEPPAAKAGRAGSVFGTLAWSLESGLGDVDLRWTDGGLETKLLAAGGISGQWKKAGAGSSGTVEIGDARIPGAVFGLEEEAMAFEKGDGVLGLDGGRLRVASLRLSGERRALRATGTLSAEGALDLVVIIGIGATREALQELPHESTPGEWLETARGSFRAFRVTGTPVAPVVREIGDLDPAFVRR